MADQEMDDLQNTDSEDIPVAEESAAEQTTPEEQSTAGEEKEAYKGYREASYGVLFVAAVFIINAMETGSYRTPWPVAIIVSLVGLGLFGYSWVLQSKGSN